LCFTVKCVSEKATNYNNKKPERGSKKNEIRKEQEGGKRKSKTKTRDFVAPGNKLEFRIFAQHILTIFKRSQDRR
jgi:hypothetical protein